MPLENAVCRDDGRQRRRQVAGLLLAQVIAHLDRQRQHLGERAGGVVVGELRR